MNKYKWVDKHSLSYCAPIDLYPADNVWPKIKGCIGLHRVEGGFRFVVPSDLFGATEELLKSLGYVSDR